MATLDSTGKASKARVKEGDDLIPKTSFKPIAAPGKLNGLKFSASYLMSNMRLVYDDILRIFIAAKIPITLWGPAGSGKTRSVEAMENDTDENGVPYQVITVQPSTEDPVTIHGMMTITEDPRTGTKLMERAVPKVADDVFRYFNDKDGLTIVFLDEMTTCNPAQQNAMLGLLTHGKYGSRNIMPYTAFAMAANPENTVSTVNPLSEAVINRGGHIPWYSEIEHWLKNWGSGFGNPANKPSVRTQTFLRDLWYSDPDIVFRADPEYAEDEDDMWNVDNLVPYSQMATSERMGVSIAQVYDIIESTFADANYEVRCLYLVEAIKAIAGPRWGRHARTVEDKIEANAGTEPAVTAIKKHGITRFDSLDEIFAKVGDSLHESRGKKMVSTEEEELAEQFRREIFADGNFLAQRYFAFWVWLATSRDETTREGVIPIAVDILFTTTTQHEEELPKAEIFPAFLPEKIREEIKSMYKIAKRR